MAKKVRRRIDLTPGAANVVVSGLEPNVSYDLKLGEQTLDTKVADPQGNVAYYVGVGAKKQAKAFKVVASTTGVEHDLGEVKLKSGARLLGHDHDVDQDDQYSLLTVAKEAMAAKHWPEKKQDEFITFLEALGVLWDKKQKQRMIDLGTEKLVDLQKDVNKINADIEG